MEERYRKSLLFDFYGELLTEHQRQVFSAAIFDDMSYSELADEFECSRQAAFDLVRRINNKLEDYENKLGLLKRFTEARDKMNELISTVEGLKNTLDYDKNSDESISDNDDIKILVSGKLDNIIDLSKQIFEEF